ncbi:VCBS domain-containing protein [Methylobacterium sp. ARG-1]|uniref:VCBS domain-containing protein n=1 Tax=Methylobacterium sp. ARG-1 TaxID=1692501 RepID=UPI0006805404|nr:VCBS domain-containing protein [Methylobacterium sp. ARG-1]
MLPTHDPIDQARSSGTFGLVEAVEHPGGAGAVIAVEAELLFRGHYARVQSDLVVSDAHHRVVIHDYFDAAIPPVLRSPDGASLPGALIASLVGAQQARVVGENAPEAPRAIGRVESASGGAAVLRNGVTVALHPGDPIYKGDVVQTDDGGKLGLTFVDGTAFNLDGESRMVVDGMNFQPGAAGNSALFSLVQGIITFVAGQTAKSGDMKVVTPSATMGIRGTAVHVEIASDHGAVKFSVMTEPDGHTGRYDVFDRDDPNHVLFTVSDPATVTTVTPNGQGQVAINSASKTAVETDHETGFLKSVFATVASGVQNPLVAVPGPTSTPTQTHAPAAGSSSPPNLVAPPTIAPLPASPTQQGSPGDHSQAEPRTVNPLLGSSDAQSSRAQDITVPASVATIQEAALHSSATAQVQPQPATETPPSVLAGASSTGSVAVASSQVAPAAAAAILAPEAATLAVPEPQAVVQVRPEIQNPAPEPPTASSEPTPSAHQVALPADLSTPVANAAVEPSEPSVTGSVPVGIGTAVGIGSATTAPTPDHPLSVADAAGAVIAAARLSADPAHGLLANVSGAAVASIGPVGGASVAMASGPLTLAGLYGTLTVLGDGSYSYSADHAAALAAGGTGIDRFAYTARDLSGHTATATLALTVTGVNDAPVFDGGATPGATLSLPTPVGSGVEHAAGSLHFSDPDLMDRPTASVVAQTISALDASGHTLNLTAAQAAVLEHAFTIAASGASTNAGSVAWSYDLADAAFAFLGAGQTARVTSTIAVDDHHGGVATQDVVIRLAGSDAPLPDPPVTGSVPVGTGGGADTSPTPPIPGHPLSVADAAGAVIAARLNADPAHGLLANVSGAAVASIGPVGGASVAMASGPLTLAGLYGTLTVLGDGSYSYSADHAAALAAGGTGIDRFAYTARDLSGHTATATLALTVTGVNDAPVFDGGATPGATLHLPTPVGSGVEHAAGSLHFSDPDLTDRPTASVVAQTIIAFDASGHTLNLTAAQAAVLEHAFTIAASGASTNAGSVAWSYDLADAAFAFLGAGQTARVTSTIAVDDHHGGVATQDVVIHLAGAAATVSPAPFALADIGGVAKGETITVDAQHGVLTNDTGHGASANLSVSSLASVNTGLAVPVIGPLAVPVFGDYGILTLSADGSYSYHAYSGALPSGIIAQDVFNYLVADQQGQSSSASLTITVSNPSMAYIAAAGSNNGSGQTLSGSSGPTVLDGGNGDDHLNAGNGPTALIGGPGDDVMTGGAGPDIFVFGGQFGHDTVHGFDVTKDVLQFDHAVFNSVSAVLAAARDSIGGVVITDPLGDSLTLLNVTKQALMAHTGDLHIV